MKEQGLSCLDFSNEEIIKYLVNVQRKFPMDIRFKIDDIYVDDSERRDFEYLIFDGEEENIFIRFDKTRFAICFGETEEMLFISDVVKKYHTISDTAWIIVYEGEIEMKTSEELLNMFSQIIDLVGGATDIHVDIKERSRKEEDSYPKCDYVIDLKNQYAEKGVYIFENITIVVK